MSPETGTMSAPFEATVQLQEPLFVYGLVGIIQEALKSCGLTMTLRLGYDSKCGPSKDLWFFDEANPEHSFAVLPKTPDQCVECTGDPCSHLHKFVQYDSIVLAGYSTEIKRVADWLVAY